MVRDSPSSPTAIGDPEVDLDARLAPRVEPLVAFRMPEGELGKEARDAEGFGRHEGEDAELAGVEAWPCGHRRQGPAVGVVGDLDDVGAVAAHAVPAGEAQVERLGVRTEHLGQRQKVVSILASRYSDDPTMTA